MSYGAATFYVFGTAVHCSALGALLTFSTVLWYPAYATHDAGLASYTLQDQQLGGLIMWVPSAAVFISIGSGAIREMDCGIWNAGMTPLLFASSA